ncbi:MAG TPA: hypothetical protein VKG25_15575 [Bryobacteraceae bacterium]|nr:hypothetical protein [Bryobacteraceae bacterium]
MLKRIYVISDLHIGGDTLLGRPYHLGSYNQKEHPMWEFITTGESIDNWKSLVTIIDRPDAHTRPELDRLAEGVMQNYRSHGAKILLAKTMVDRAGTPYNYLSAAFDEPAKNRYEFDFVKIALTPKNAYVAIYGVRISDPANYLAKAKAFLDRHSGESGAAISDIVLPDIGKLPRKEF